MTGPIRRSGAARFFAPHNPTDEQRRLMHTGLWRVAWQGTSLFDHEPQLRYFDRFDDAEALVKRLGDEVVWLVTDQVTPLCADLWPPAVGDYPFDGDAWPWELLDLNDLQAEGVTR
jgi:hypothetical protein